MAKTTQKLLIEQIKSLKGIKPRQEWAILLKSEILSTKSETNSNFQIFKFSKHVSNFDIRISNFFSGKRLAYSFATLVFVIVGLVGFAQHTMPGDLLFPVKKIAEQSQASLSGKNEVKQNVATLNNRISDLAQATKQGKKNKIPSAISEINAQASELTKDFKNNLITDSETVKEIAVSLQVLAYVPGTDLSENPDVKSLCEAVVQNQITDLEKATLTEAQGEILLEVKELYEAGKYMGALEKILMIGKTSVDKEEVMEEVEE